jgi:hypothetical protein
MGKEAINTESPDHDSYLPLPIEMAQKLNYKLCGKCKEAQEPNAREAVISEALEIFYNQEWDATDGAEVSEEKARRFHDLLWVRGYKVGRKTAGDKGRLQPR